MLQQSSEDVNLRKKMIKKRSFKSRENLRDVSMDSLEAIKSNSNENGINKNEIKENKEEKEKKGNDNEKDDKDIKMNQEKSNQSGDAQKSVHKNGNISEEDEETEIIRKEEVQKLEEEQILAKAKQKKGRKLSLGPRKSKIDIERISEKSSEKILEKSSEKVTEKVPEKATEEKDVAFFRPTDRIVLNEHDEEDAALPEVENLVDNPVLLAIEAFEVSF